MALLVFLPLANLNQVHLYSVFVFANSILSFILPFVSPDPVMGRIFRDRVDWVCPSDSFSEIEAQAEAPTYLKWGHILPSFYHPPAPNLQQVFGTLRKKRLGPESEAKGAGFFQSYKMRRLMAAKKGEVAALSSLFWRKEKSKTLGHPCSIQEVHGVSRMILRTCWVTRILSSSTSEGLTGDLEHGPPVGSL